MTTKNPSTQPAPTGAQTGRLLSAEEKAICEQVASGETLDSRRARALLAIDGGATQIEAGRQAGLTPGRTRYCLRKFRQQGLTFFPDAAPEPIPQPEPEAAPEPVSEPDPTLASEPEPVAGNGGAETMVEKPRSKAGDKTGKGKKATRKKKKPGKKKKDGKKGRKSKSAKSSRKKERKSKSGKSSRKKKKSKGAKKSNKKRKKKSKR